MSPVYVIHGRYASADNYFQRRKCLLQRCIERKSRSLQHPVPGNIRNYAFFQPFRQELADKALQGASAVFHPAAYGYISVPCIGSHDNFSGILMQPASHALRFFNCNAAYDCPAGSGIPYGPEGFVVLDSAAPFYIQYAQGGDFFQRTEVYRTCGPGSFEVNQVQPFHPAAGKGTGPFEGVAAVVFLCRIIALRQSRALAADDVDGRNYVNHRLRKF